MPKSVCSWVSAPLHVRGGPLVVCVLSGKRVQELKDAISGIQQQCATVKKKRKALEAELDALDRHPPSAPKKAATEAQKASLAPKKASLAPKAQKPAVAPKAQKASLAPKVPKLLAIKAKPLPQVHQKKEEKGATLKEQTLALLEDSGLSDHRFCEDLCDEMGGSLSFSSLRRWLGLDRSVGVSAKLTEQIEEAIAPVLARRHKKT